MTKHYFFVAGSEMNVSSSQFRSLNPALTIADPFVREEACDRLRRVGLVTGNTVKFFGCKRKANKALEGLMKDIELRLYSGLPRSSHSGVTLSKSLYKVMLARETLAHSTEPAATGLRSLLTPSSR